MERVWFRSPNRIAGEIGEVGHLCVTWSRSELNKTKTDPKAFGNIHWGTSSNWQGLIIGAGSAIHVDADHGLDEPRAVYPVWEYGEQWGVLEEVASNPIGMNEEVCNDPVIETAWRPVYGQEHMIVITGMPDFSTGIGKAFMRRLMEFQNDFPDCCVFIDGSSSYNVLYGMNFQAGNVDSHSMAKDDQIMLPSGRRVKLHSFPAHTKWIHLLGASIPELREEGKRVRFNLRSALWAANNFDKEVNFKTRHTSMAPPLTIDPNDPGAQMELAQRPQQLQPAQPGDKVNCDDCSLQMSCKSYRQGSVCTLPKSETVSLAKMFGTRDADMIVDALGILVGRQATRVERGLSEEEVLGVLDPQVAKDLNSTIDNGIKLAKLVDPSRAGGTQVSVNVGAQGAASQVSMQSPNAIVGQIVREIQQRTGIPASQITPEMIAQAMTQMAGGQQVVQGEIVR